MPGLFGIFQKKPKLSRFCLLNMAKRMAESMRHTPWLRTDIWGNDFFCGGRVHLGVLNPFNQPVTLQDGIKMWLDGEVYCDSDNSTTETIGKTSKLINGLSKGNVNGVFNAAYFDSNKQELTLINDRLGFRPLYYMETEDWFAYAGEVKALLTLLDRTPKVDEVSLRQFFGFNHMLGNRTWWEGIEMVPSASVFTVSENGVTVRSYWSFDEIKSQPQDPMEVEKEFSNLWSLDVSRHSKEGTMPFLLSGGLDSRFLLAELIEQGADLVAITFGSEESAEMKPASYIASVAGIPHRRCYLNTDNWWHRREEAIWQTDGLVNANHLHYAITMDYMHTGNLYSPINIVGDLLFGGSHLDKNSMYEWKSFPAGLLKKWYIKNPFFSFDEVISFSDYDLSNSLQGPSSDCFHLRNRYRRYVLYIAVCLASHCEMSFPGISYDFLRLFLGSLSDEQRLGHKFYNRFLVTKYPKYFRNIPWQVTGRGLSETFPTRLSRSLLRRVFRLMGKKVRYRPPSSQWFVNYPECVRRSRLREWLMYEKLIADELLNGAIKKALKDHTSDSVNVETLIAIFTFETYLRQVAGMPGFTFSL